MKFDTEYKQLEKLLRHYSDIEFVDKGKAMMPLAYAIWGGDPTKVGTVAKGAGAVAAFFSIFVTGIPGLIGYKLFNNTNIKIEIIIELMEIINNINGNFRVRGYQMENEQISEKYKKERNILLKVTGHSAAYSELLQIADKLDQHFDIKPSILELNSRNFEDIPQTEEKSSSCSLNTFSFNYTPSSSSSISLNSSSSSLPNLGAT